VADRDDDAPRVEHVGVDAGEVIRGTIATLAQRQAEGDLHFRKLDSEYQYDANETIYVLVTEYPRLRESDPPRFSAETVDELPLIGRVRTLVPRKTPRGALADLRVELARAWTAARLCEDYEQAHSRAGRATLLQHIIPGAA
jgi:hypothetical protein